MFPRNAEFHSAVSQIFNLHGFRLLNAIGGNCDLPTESRRYSRVELCVTRRDLIATLRWDNKDRHARRGISTPTAICIRSSGSGPAPPTPATTGVVPPRNAP